MDKIVKELMKKGVVKGRSKLLSELEMEEFSNLILKSKDKHLNEGEIAHNIVGINKRIDELLEKILINPEIQNTFREILGENYLIRQITVRYSHTDDKGLELHQDSIGETSLIVILNNQSEGATAFLPGSQLIPSKKNFASMVSWNSFKLINIMKYFLFSAVGKSGDYYYFNHRTWHCRTPGKNQKTKISVFFNMYPVFAKRKDFLIESENKSKCAFHSMINSKFVTQPNLKKMLSRENYHTALKNFEKEINVKPPLISKANSYEQIYKNKFYFIYIILKIVFLELCFFPIKIKRYFKN